MRARDGSAWLVFNGEIYNYRELRTELEAEGYIFSSTGDAEVLLHWLRHHGADGLKRLNGMFALAFLDLRERKLMLARDRVGVKPLLYHFDSERITFGSEIKAIVAAANLQPEVDKLAVTQYFCFNYVPAPRTIFRGIHKLEPGHFIELSLDRPSQEIRPQRFWQIRFDPLLGRSDGEWVEEIESLLSDAVSLRLASDVPVGVFLSGGLDSSLVTALAVASHQRRALVAFTVGFSEAEWDESSVASSVARHCGIAHHVQTLQPDAWEVLSDLVWHYEEPFADSSSVPTYYLCQAAAKHATVFLSGDGGDEAFAGYGRYQSARATDWLDNIAAPFRQGGFSALASITPISSLTHYRALRAAMPKWKRHATQCNFPGDPLNLFPLAPELQRLRENEIAGFLYDIAREADDLDPESRLQYIDYRLYLSNDILVKVDRASMAHSIEVRSPFLDYRLIELAARIPSQQQYQGNQGKRILWQLAPKYLPQPALTHRKQGFGLPLPLWFRGEALRRVEEILTSRAALERGFYDLKAIKQLIDWQQRGRGRDLSHVLWRLLFFEEWARQFVDARAETFEPTPAVAVAV